MISDYVGLISPYLLESPPASSNRVLLSRGFAHYCLLHWGFSGTDIDEAFSGRSDDAVRERVLGAMRLIGGLFATGSIKCWARPLGGGEPSTLRATAWELDDFAARFATSAIDPKRPYDQEATPTHWIFVDLEDWNGVLEASVSETLPDYKKTVVRAGRPEQAESVIVTATQGEPHERLIRLPEVKHRTGLSRSTIYRKMQTGRFPKGLALSPNVTAWREPEIAEWIARPS